MIQRLPQSGLRRCAAIAILCSLSWLWPAGAETAPPAPQVEVEEIVYRYEPADNGAGPLWCGGSTCLVRAGDVVYASGLETLKDAKPLNNCRWLLFRRDTAGWTQVAADPVDRTREPSPLGLLGSSRLLLSVNPTLAKDPTTYAGPARPDLLEFALRDPAAPPRSLAPRWAGEPKFTEHSYRSFAVDGVRGEAVLFQNIDYTHAEWTFLDREGRWSAQGQLRWPWGADYAKPQPIRVCYPNVAVVNRAVYFCGVSDIVEPNPEWRAFKKELTGREWDYDFRRLFFTWSPDISHEPFREWAEIASRERTCGWVSPGDLWMGADGTVHIVWTERAIDERLRARFYPEAKQRHALEYAALREGKVVRRQTLLEGGEGLPSGEVPSAARFHANPGGPLRVLCYVGGTAAGGKAVSENRLLTLSAAGAVTASVRVPLAIPFTSYFTATPRAGSATGEILDLLGQRAGEAQTLAYARLRLPP